MNAINSDKMIAKMAATSLLFFQHVIVPMHLNTLILMYAKHTYSSSLNVAVCQMRDN